MMNTFEESNYNQFNFNDENQSVTKTCDLYGKARASFIQKVYTILTSKYQIS